MLYPDLFCASASKMCPKVIASLLSAILAYKKLHRNALFWMLGKLYLNSDQEREGTGVYFIL